MIDVRIAGTSPLGLREESLFPMLIPRLRKFAYTAPWRSRLGRPCRAARASKRFPKFDQTSISATWY